jgi:serine/threonine protein kinase/ABC-type branched-subunit amino acid transport system substrate-binding protein
VCGNRLALVHYPSSEREVRISLSHVPGSNELSGKFRFIAEIGHGGMSEVYLTLTQGGLGGFQKLVAVKLLRRDLAKDEDFRRMFLEEARLTARLNHPNVVQTNDVGDDQGRYYIAMEYLEGQTFERIRRAKNAAKHFPLPMQIQMLVQALAGLHYAHELTDYDNTPLAIVHRDVTPSNVFVTYDGQVKLVDFGIAKVFDSLNHTRVGVLKGKARYMAPEQITGVTIDRRADIFSVGVMLWEMLSGTQIWLGRSETEILRRVSAGDVPLPPRDAPFVLQQICTKAMAFHADDRFPTADALRLELEGYLAQHATPVRDSGMGPAVVELFRDERTQIRQVIETQMRSVRSSDETAQLPALNDVRGKQTGELYGAYGGTPPSGAGPRTSQAMQLTYGGQTPAPVDSTHGGTRAGVAAALSRRKLMYAGGGAAALLLLGIFALTRGHGSADRTEKLAEKTGSASPAASAPAVPLAAHTVSPAVRGVTDDTITLGMSAAFSGASRELGNRMKLGLETAFAAVNEGGGISGRTIKLLALDDGYEGKRALANVQELISDRNAFAIIGNVGTPTAKEALPYVLSRKTLFFGGFTGTSLLRRDPPDRYVFNYRASYEDETAKMVNYLIDVKKVPDRGIVVFAQNDSYGDAGFEGATKMLRKKGRADDVLRVGYDRNTLEVDDAVGKVLDYNAATVRIGNEYQRKHPVKAIIMVGTYKACAKFIQKIRDKKLDAILLNVSFVGSSSLAEELKELGGGNYGNGVIVTQVVPHFDSGATGIIRYREALKKYHPDQQPDFISLEGYVVGQLFAEGLRRVGHDLDTEKLVDALEHLQDYDAGTGSSLGFSPSQHQATHKVWGTMLDDQGTFKSIDME